MYHVIMFREIGGEGIGSRRFDVQAVCSCEWESDIHAEADKVRAQMQGALHLEEYKVPRGAVRG